MKRWIGVQCLLYILWGSVLHAKIVFLTEAHQLKSFLRPPKTSHVLQKVESSIYKGCPSSFIVEDKTFCNVSATLVRSQACPWLQALRYVPGQKTLETLPFKTPWEMSSGTFFAVATVNRAPQKALCEYIDAFSEKPLITTYYGLGQQEHLNKRWLIEENLPYYGQQKVEQHQELFCEEAYFALANTCNRELPYTLPAASQQNSALLTASNYYGSLF